MGTPDFAVPCLERLIKDGHNVCAVFTKPDKPKGRGYEISQSPVKKVAVDFKIPVYQPLKLKDDKILESVTNLNPDLIVVVAYGKILPKEILSVPKFGCVNIHGSLLPRYRGAAPIQWAVIDGQETTGVTAMYMDEGLDTGDIIKTAETKIGQDETSGELFGRLCILGANLLSETVESISNADVTRKKQNESEATYSKMLDRSLSEIDWSKDAKSIHNLVRGLNPWPSASTKVRNKILKIHKTKLINETCKESPGKIIAFNPVKVVCGSGSVIELIEVQYEGKKKMSATDFFRGHRDILNF